MSQYQKNSAGNGAIIGVSMFLAGMFVLVFIAVWQAAENRNHTVAETAEPTPMMRVQQALALDLQQWRSERDISFATSPCDARRRYLRYESDFRQYMESPLIDEKIKKELGDQLFLYMYEYADSAIKKKRAGLALDCGPEESALLEEAGRLVHSLPKKDVEFLREALIKALRRELNALMSRRMDISGGGTPDLDLIREIEEKYAHAESIGISRAELEK